MSAAVPNTCPQCTVVESGHRFCPSCGSKLGAAAPVAPAARLVALNPDGSEGTTVPLSGQVTVGRSNGGVFGADVFLSPVHASFVPEGAHVVVTDEHSLNGIYRRLPADQRYPLSAGQLFRIGQELVRFEQITPKPPDEFGVEHMGAPLEGYVGRIAMVTGRSSTGTAFPIPETGLNLGRERGEVLFADDGYVSGLHCRLSFERGQVYLTDLGSSNGTFVRVVGSEHFANGEVLLMGQQLFRIAM
jgi:pSer/pThr/pTyr-binding forkhead associated (FHA) protein